MLVWSFPLDLPPSMVHKGHPTNPGGASIELSLVPSSLAGRKSVVSAGLILAGAPPLELPSRRKGTPSSTPKITKSSPSPAPPLLIPTPAPVFSVVRGAAWQNLKNSTKSKAQRPLWRVLSVVRGSLAIFLKISQVQSSAPPLERPPSSKGQPGKFFENFTKSRPLWRDLPVVRGSLEKFLKISLSRAPSGETSQ